MFWNKKNVLYFLPFTVKHLWIYTFFQDLHYS